MGRGYMRDMGQNGQKCPIKPSSNDPSVAGMYEKVELEDAQARNDWIRLFQLRWLR